MATAVEEYEEIESHRGETFMVEIDRVTSELNPREHFDGESIAALAATLKTSGMIQPITIRVHPTKKDFYQLVAGGRRLKAAEAAGWKAVPSIVRGEMSDAEALEIALIENFQREDLSPIEEARAFQEFCKPLEAGGLGYTQQRLADRLGCSQPHIANRLRLLHLPKKWQERIVGGEIPHSHARHLVSIAKHKAIMAEFDARWRGAHAPVAPGGEERGELSEEDFRGLIAEVAEETTRPMQHVSWVAGLGNVGVFTPTPEQLEQLCVIDVPQRFGEDGIVQRATNVALWDNLQEAHLERLRLDAEMKAERAEKRGAKVAGRQSPAQAKAASAKKAEQFKKWLADWKLDWYRYLVGERLKKFDPRRTSEAARMVPTKLLLWLSVNHDHKLNRHDDLDAATRSQIPKSLNQARWGFDGVRSIQARDIPALANEFLRNLLYHDQEGPSGTFPADVIEPTIEDLEIKPADEWMSELAGPLTDAYFDLHTKDQLDELALDWEIDTAADAWTKPKKSERIELLRASSVIRAKLPAELRPPEAAKKRAAKGAKRKAKK
jgi:ParB/RepB/Spo0J family partition protein